MKEVPRAEQAQNPAAGRGAVCTLQLSNTKELIKTSHEILLSADNNWTRQLRGASAAGATVNALLPDLRALEGRHVLWHCFHLQQ